MAPFTTLTAVLSSSIVCSSAIKIFVKDRLSQSKFDLILGSGTPQLAFAQGGVAINGMYDESLNDGLQINGKLYLNGTEITN